MATRRQAWFGLTTCVTALWMLAACSSDGGGGRGGLAALGVDDGASKGVAKSAQVTGEKNVRIELDTGALVDVPAGAVDKEVKLTIERPNDTKAVALVGKLKQDQDLIVSAPYVLTPHGTKFKEDVTVTLPLAKEGKREVQVAWLEDEDDTEWKLLGTAKTDGKKAQITVKHFSVLVVIEDGSDLRPMEDIDVPADAGAVADAGGAALDAGEARDASVEPEQEAGSAEAAVREAGSASDAGAALDAGDDYPDARAQQDGGTGTVDGGSRSDGSTLAVDAGDDEPMPPDGSVGTPDAYVPPPDAYVPPSDSGAVTAEGGVSGEAGSALSTAQYDDLMTCSRVAVEGQFAPNGLYGSPYDSHYFMCLHQCYVDHGTCYDNVAYRCGDLTAAPSFGLDECLWSCAEPTSNCPNDPNTPMNECDGIAQCPFGVDEQNCNPNFFFTCQGSERIPWYKVCNNLPDCSGNQDEASCFFCDSSTRKLPPYRVCDGVINCNDQSDELQGCAVVQCVLPD
jgi:hypothetical protein